LPAPSQVEPADSCPFGGCTIDDTGRILGYDPTTNQFAVRTGGASGSTVELPIVNKRGDVTYALALNDAGQIPYFYAANSPTAVAIYNVNSETSTPVPAVAGTSCKYYYPVSINNVGQVLGFASDCSKAGFYWTWDSTHGTQELNTQIAANPYKIAALGINDNGQILVSLTTSTGAVHWGTLNPATTAAHPKLLARIARNSGAPASPRYEPTAISGYAGRPASFGAAVTFDGPANVRSPFGIADPGNWASHNALPRAGITRRLRLAAAPSYTINNIGAPTGYLGSSPSGFNDTGQIFGQAYNVGNFVADCIVWTGSSFERLPFPSDTIPGTSCTAAGINDADAKTGSYQVVGSSTEEFSNQPHAFAAIAGPAGIQRTTTYFANAPSSMVGVNAGGTAVASAEYGRDTLYDLQGLHYFTTLNAAGSLTLLQTPGSAGAPPVHYLLPAYLTPCPFGGCAINGKNQVLGFDYLTSYDQHATAAFYTVGKPTSLTHVPIQEYSSALFAPTLVAFNNANQILYADPQLGPAIYNIGTGARTVIPVQAPNCQSQLATPLSMNDKGEVLGFVDCPAGITVYFTWDAAGGTKFLSAEIPSNPYTIKPLGVNNNGQILIQLTSSANVNSWGTLDPIAPKASSGRTRYTNERAK
jgi:hypothetical protein